MARIDELKECISTLRENFQYYMKGQDNSIINANIMLFDRVMDELTEEFPKDKKGINEVQ